MYTSVTILFICEHTFKSISIPISLTLQLITNHMVVVLSYNFNQPKKNCSEPTDKRSRLDQEVRALRVPELY